MMSCTPADAQQAREGLYTTAADQTDPRLCMFSSDYPHVEGGRRPVERFEASLGERPETERLRFYRDNFLDLIGAAARDLATTC